MIIMKSLDHLHQARVVQSDHGDIVDYDGFADDHDGEYDCDDDHDGENNDDCDEYYEKPRSSSPSEGGPIRS